MTVEFVSIRVPGIDGSVRVAFRRDGPSSDPAAAGRAPLIMLHGLGLSSYSWRHVQRCLAARRETFALDLLGFGRSDKPRKADYRLPVMSRAVLATMDALKIDCAALAGHSLGGGVALIAALMAPNRVGSLILAGSVAYPQPEPPFVTLPRLPLAWVPMMLFPKAFIREGLRQVYVDPGLPDEAAVREYSAPYRIFAGAAAYQRICRALRPAELNEYTCHYRGLSPPLLILHGDRDNVVPIAIAERLHREVASSEFHPLKGAGHMLIEEEPDRVAGFIESFLAPEFR